MRNTPRNERPRALLAAVSLCLAVGVTVRIGLFHLYGYVGHSDQVEYLRMAQEFIEGTIRPHVFPPGLPLLIAGAHGMGVDMDRAGQAVSLVTGILLLPLLYLLGKSLYGEVGGLLALGLAAIHPQLLRRSIDGMSETPFMFFVYGGLLCVLFAFESKYQRRYLWAIAGGLAIGCAWLVRPEGILYGVAFLVFLVAGYWRSGARRPARLHAALCVAAAAAAFVVVSGVISYATTGSWQCSNKALYNLVLGHVEYTGEVEPDALTATGQTAFKVELDRATSCLAYVSKDPRQHLRRYLHNVFATYFRYLPGLLDPLLIVAATLGLARRGTVQHQRRHWVLVAPWVILLVYPVFFVRPRFLVPLLPTALLWAGGGLARLCTGHLDGVSSVRQQQSRTSNWFVVTAFVGALLFMYSKPLLDIVRHPYVGAVPFEERVVGEYLRDRGFSGQKILAEEPALPYYAGMVPVGMPHTSVNRLIEYARQHGVRYLAVVERYLEHRPQLQSLIDPAAAPRSLRVVCQTQTPKHWKSDARVVIYEIVPQASR